MDSWMSCGRMDGRDSLCCLEAWMAACATRTVPVEGRGAWSTSGTTQNRRERKGDGPPWWLDRHDSSVTSRDFRALYRYWCMTVLVEDLWWYIVIDVRIEQRSCWDPIAPLHYGPPCGAPLDLVNCRAVEVTCWTPKTRRESGALREAGGTTNSSGSSYRSHQLERKYKGRWSSSFESVFILASRSGGNTDSNADCRER